MQKNPNVHQDSRPSCGIPCLLIWEPRTRPSWIVFAMLWSLSARTGGSHPMLSTYDEFPASELSETIIYGQGAYMAYTISVYTIWSSFWIYLTTSGDRQDRIWWVDSRGKPFEECSSHAAGGLRQWVETSLFSRGGGFPRPMAFATRQVLAHRGTCWQLLGRPKAQVALGGMREKYPFHLSCQLVVYSPLKK